MIKILAKIVLGVLALWMIVTSLRAIRIFNKVKYVTNDGPMKCTLGVWGLGKNMKFRAKPSVLIDIWLIILAFSILALYLIISW